MQGGSGRQLVPIYWSEPIYWFPPLSWKSRYQNQYIGSGGTHHTRGFMTRLSSHNRQKSSKSPAGRKTQKSTVSFFWVLVIQMTYKAGNALTHIPRAQKCPKTRFLGGVIWTPNRPYGSVQSGMGRCWCWELPKNARQR